MTLLRATLTDNEVIAGCALLELATPQMIETEPTPETISAGVRSLIARGWLFPDGSSLNPGIERILRCLTDSTVGILITHSAGNDLSLGTIFDDGGARALQYPVSDGVHEIKLTDLPVAAIIGEATGLGATPQAEPGRTAFLQTQAASGDDPEEMSRTSIVIALASTDGAPSSLAWASRTDGPWLVDKIDGELVFTPTDHESLEQRLQSLLGAPGSNDHIASGSVGDPV